MRIEKEKRRVGIICMEGSFLSGFIHINPGERATDFLNDEKKQFIALTDAELQNIDKARSFRLTSEMAKKNTILLNKSSIIMVREL